MGAYWIVCRDCGNGQGWDPGRKNIDVSVWKRFICSSCQEAGGKGKRIQVSESTYDRATLEVSPADLAASGRAILF